MSEQDGSARWTPDREADRRAEIAAGEDVTGGQIPADALRAELAAAADGLRVRRLPGLTVPAAKGADRVAVYDGRELVGLGVAVGRMGRTHHLYILDPDRPGEATGAAGKLVASTQAGRELAAALVARRLAGLPPIRGRGGATVAHRDALQRAAAALGRHPRMPDVVARELRETARQQRAAADRAAALATLAELRPPAALPFDAAPAATWTEAQARARLRRWPATGSDAVELPELARVHLIDGWGIATDGRRLGAMPIVDGCPGVDQGTLAPRLLELAREMDAPASADERETAVDGATAAAAAGALARLHRATGARGGDHPVVLLADDQGRLVALYTGTTDVCLGDDRGDPVRVALGAVDGPAGVLGAVPAGQLADALAGAAGPVRLRIRPARAPDPAIPDDRGANAGPLGLARQDGERHQIMTFPRADVDRQLAAAGVRL